MLTWLCQCLVWYLFHATGLEEGHDYFVHNKRFYRSIILYGSLGLGESYTAGDWSTPDLHKFLACLCIAPHIKQIQQLASWLSPLEWWRWFTTCCWNPQTLRGSRKVAEVHYNLDPNMYEKMLSSPMMYSCAYWKEAKTLEAAQLNKIMLLGRKLQLSAEHTVLDIGCGWGDLAIILAQKFGCQVVGLTISTEQCKIARQRAAEAGVSDKVTFILQDYREHQGCYDRVVSVGMAEHVGWQNLQTYFKCVHQFLKSGGLAVIHSITGRTNGPVGDAWIEKYIFPNSAIPSHEALISALRPVNLEIEDIQNFGPDYALTLAAWLENFNTLCASTLNPVFVRTWRYYLIASEVQFIIRGLQLFQIVLSKDRRERYDAPR
jgi:cyclopropane-fatty-acyl-phospholipid synthase